MFQRDAVKIRSEALKSSDVMAKVIIFVIATANAPLHHAVRFMFWLAGQDITDLVYSDLPIKVKSLAANALNSKKLASMQYIWLHREAIHKEYLTLDAKAFWEYAIDTLPYLGMVKSAFVVQMLYNELGCIDTHNLKVLGLDRKAVSGDSIKKREQYLQIQSSKTSEQWWDGWCNYLATDSMFRARYESGDYVSKLHTLAILGV